MDFAMGPNQGAGVPAPIDSDGLMWDVVAYNVSVPIGGQFNGKLPGWGSGSLEAAVAGTVTGSKVFTNKDSSGGLPGDRQLARTEYTLSASSLTDVTDKVDAKGNLQLNFASSNQTGTHHIIFAIYVIKSLYRAQQGPLEMKGPHTSPQSWVHNGSWAVDHFSALGAQTMTKFWEEYIVNNGTRTMLMDVGNYAWEDSVEIEANVYWTKNLSSIFSSDHGYSIKKWLPVLFHRNGHYKNSNPGVWWVTDEADQGKSHIADYRATVLLFRFIHIGFLLTASSLQPYIVSMNQRSING